MKIGQGTRVLVTGASRGIGRAIAEEMAGRGAAVGLVARSGEEIEELAGRLPGEHHQVLPADIGDREAIAGAVEAFGDCDVLVANAGLASSGPFVDMDPDEVERMTRVNWLGTAWTVKAALPGMLRRGRGHVVVVSSGAALRSFPEAAVYGATKAAQRAFAEALRHELAGTGVSVTVVFPGEVTSELHTHEMDRLPEWNQRDEAVSAESLARALVKGVEGGAAAVYHPPLVRALRVSHGISTRLADVLVRRVRGPSAAPRRD